MAPGISWLTELRRRVLIPGSPAVGYLFASVFVAVAALVHALMLFLSAEILPFVSYYPAILLATLVGGAGPGSLAAFLSALSVGWYFPSPYFGPGAVPLTLTINLALYIIAAALIIWTAESARHVRAEELSLLRGSVKSAAADKPFATPYLGAFGRLVLEGLPQNSAISYVLALACVAVATLVRIAFGWMSEDVLLFSSYYPAILFVTLLAGIGPGVFAVVATAIIVDWALVPPQFAFVWPTGTDALNLAFFSAVSAITVLLAEAYRRAIRHLRDEEAKRVLLLRELQHRNRNTLSVVQSIISQSLRGNLGEAEKINGRIRALAATNELLTASERSTADLKSVLLAELKPYGEARVALRGGSLNLDADLARVLTLTFHELTTNAAKYGALSQPEGLVSVSWATIDGGVHITWVETGGPPVVAPEKQGFGTYFLARVLASLHGKVETDFHPNGIVCTIVFTPIAHGQRTVSSFGSKPSVQVTAGNL